MALTAVAMSKDRSHPSVLSDEIVSLMDASSPVPFTFRLPLAARGRAQASLRMPLTAKVSDLKRLLHAQERFDRKLGELELYIQGEELMDDRTMLSYEQEGLKGLIQVRGGYKEVLITSASVPLSFPVLWAVHSTVTDLVVALYRRLKNFVGQDAVNLDNVRLRHRRETGGPLVDLPIKAAYRYSDLALDWDSTLADLKLASSSEPCTVKFRRSTDGKLVHLTFNLSGSASVRDVHDSVIVAQRRAEGSPDDDGWVNSVLRPQSERAPAAVRMRQSRGEPTAWDDDSPAAVPTGGQKRVYLYTPSMPGYIQSSDLEDGAVYFAYTPPPQQPPEFISIEQDHTIPHLSDLGILPGADLELSFWSSTWKIWSSDVTRLVLSEPPCEDITVRMSGGARVRIPAAAAEKFEEVLLKLWCACGAPPQDAVLMSEDGAILDEFRSMADYGILPESTLHCAYRPRPWDPPEAKEKALRPPPINADFAVP